MGYCHASSRMMFENLMSWKTVESSWRQPTAQEFCSTYPSDPKILFGKGEVENRAICYFRIALELDNHPQSVGYS